MAEGNGFNDSVVARFEIKKIRKHFEDTGYTIAEAKFTEYHSKVMPPTAELIVTGNFVSVFEGDEFEGEGKWVNHNIFGHQFQVGLPKRIVPQSMKGIEEFLRRYVRGLGKKTAQKIVNHFGESTLSSIEQDWKNLLQVGGISAERAKKIQEKLFKHKKFEEIGMFVLNHGGGYKTALRVYDFFGEAAIMKIRENPYSLCGVEKLDFTIADTFAKSLGFSYQTKERIKEGIAYFLEWCSKARGDLYVSSNEIKMKLSTFLSKHGAFKESESILRPSDIEKCLEELKSAGRIVIEVNHQNEECVYLKNFNFIENRIVSLLKKLVEEPKTPICTQDQIGEFVEYYEKTFGFKFAEKQKSAIYMALLNGISILTGRPGTGKTQTINSIIQCVKYVNPAATIHLFAPTGKASKRMSELTGMEAMTIHRGIGIGFENDDQEMNIVDGDLLVVDETSMMDAYVCYRLLSCVHQNIRILFVGDFEQLPSVGAGLILRDLIYSKRIPTTRLTEIFRQSKESQIVMNAHKVAEGITSTDTDGLTFDISKQDFYFIERPDRMRAQKTLIECVQRFLNQGFKLDDIQILAPMRKGDLGVWSLNRLMQETFNQRAKGKNEVKLNEMMYLREGDKVIHTVNNADLGVYNGEVGKVLRIYEDVDDGLQVEVEYDDGKVVIYDHLTVEEIEHAFVTTIHKSQGSEYPIVIMPIHDSQSEMLTRNLIYTGLTRAKKKVVMVGTKTALDNGIRRVDNLVRNSNIKEKIIDEITPLVA